MTDSTAVLNAILTMLDDHEVAYRHLEHAPTRTSEESAAARGESVRIGGKALVIRTGDVFRLFVLSAARKLDSAAIRREFSTRHARFATPEELLDLTGLVPGSVPAVRASDPAVRTVRRSVDSGQRAHRVQCRLSDPFSHHEHRGLHAAGLPPGVYIRARRLTFCPIRTCTGL